MDTNETSDTPFCCNTAAFGAALLDAPVMRPWPLSLDEARKILAGQPYEVLERIGHGGMGAVFKVRNLEPGMGRIEAVKIRRPEARDDDMFRERFLREIGTLAELRHPGITTIYRSGDSAEGYLWFCMEFLEGRSLADLLGPGLQALSPERVLDIARQLCITLQFVHKAGRLHRDLKPANVMVCDDGSVRLLDFGIGCAAEPSVMGILTRPGENPHTPDFAAPEQKNGGAVDERTDLYGLGRIVTAMIRPTDVSAREPQPRMSKRLLDLVDDLLAFDRNDRPSSAADVFEKLGQIEPGSPGFWGKDRCPFRGLEAYQPEHAEIFFGRDAAIRRGQEILRLRSEAAWNGFLLITGASGSGKSSLARAGLGPALLRGTNPAAGGNARIAPIICDLSAILAESDCLIPPLARLLASSLPTTSSNTLADALRESSAELGRCLGMPPDPAPSIQYCLILDQFEHFFRADLPRSAQARFLTAIARLARTPGIAVLVTLRSDFYHKCASHPSLMELKDGRQLDVASPQPWELAAILRLSARAGGLAFETAPDGRGLDDVLLEHTRRNPQVLPLLSYVLEQLWQRRDILSNLLRYSDYETLGGFEGAVGIKARETLARFADDFPNDASGAVDDLLHLVVEASDFGNGDAFVRRRASPDELSAAAPSVRHLAERLVTARLLVHDASGLTLAHDALLSAAVVSQWEALRQWLEHSAQDLRMRERVALRYRDWLNHDRAGDLLLPAGLLLSDAIALLRARPSVFCAEQHSFIQQSAAATAEKTLRATRRRRIALAILSLLTFTACISALWARKREQDSSAARNMAEAAKAKAQESEKIATRAQSAAESLIGTMIYDLRDKLAPLGHLDLLDDVSKHAEIYFKNNPSTSADALRDEAAMWDNRGKVLNQSGDVMAARGAFEKSQEIRMRLAVAAPLNVQAQRDLSVSYDRLGAIAQVEGNFRSAHTAFEKGLEIAKRLAEADPPDVQAQRDLSASYDSLGGVVQAEGDLKAARQAFEQGMGIAKRLAEGHPLDVQAQRDLGVSYDRLGGIAQAEGDLKSARRDFERSLEIVKLLTEADPRNAQTQRDLIVSYHNLGDIALADDDVKTASEAFEKGLEIAKSLAKMDPRNIRAQQDLWEIMGQLAAIAAKEHSYMEAVHITERSLQLADKSNSRGLISTLYNNLSWYLLLAMEFAKAQEAAEKGLRLDPQSMPLYANVAHSHLLRGQYKEAEAIYLKYKDELMNDKQPWQKVIAEDFHQLRDAGLKHSDMARIEKLLGVAE